MLDAPKIEDAPGLVWRRIKVGWQARWQARTDLVNRGFLPKSVKLWNGAEPNEVERDFIADYCRHMQAEMLVWGRGGIEPAGPFVGTLASLIACYRTDEDSSYRKLRHKSRTNYDGYMRRLSREYGETPLAEIDMRVLLQWHKAWVGDGKIAAAHSMVAMLRTLFTFGKTLLKDADCARIKSDLHDMRFPMPKPRAEIVTADQVTPIRDLARQRNRPSIAIAQAFQFECTLRQKDVIGEWVPNSEPGMTDVHRGNEKWLRGLRWSEIDVNLILTHVTSKRQKELVVDLKLAPMVLEELAVAYPGSVVWNAETRKPIIRRELLPASGPIVVSEITEAPYSAFRFRREWRSLARAVGVPDHIFNMDNRAGAISEATDSGADMEQVRHAATHSNIATTQIYSRNAAKKVAAVMELRVAKRNRNTDD